MTEAVYQQETTIQQHSTELEFDCPSTFDFKDPNDDDLCLNSLFGKFYFKSINLILNCRFF